MKTRTDQALGGQSIYQIFVRNFTPEGTLDAAIPELERIAGLGFDIIYLAPIHPVGTVARKGILGSPYAIADYRRVDPSLGGEKALDRFLAAAHALGLQVIMDIVFNHTSPDSTLAKTHPEWFIKGKDGKPGRKVDDWSDVVDFDFSVPAVHTWLVDTLLLWLDRGIDGFRCDVASLVPLDFWMEARARTDSVRPTIWLAESVHKEFVAFMRSQGHYAACDAELHSAFDLTYDYDGREYLDCYLRGERPIGDYLEFIGLQSCMYPAGALKARCLENHDQERIASLVPQSDRLMNLNALWMLLPGTYFAYMGQEWALTHKPDLFSRDPLDRSAIDKRHSAFFATAHPVLKELRGVATDCSFRELAAGVVLAQGRNAAGIVYTGIFNLDGRRGYLDTAETGLSGFRGRDALNGTIVTIGDRLELCRDPLVLVPV
ncbi:MAG: alpha-amylase family glycosyl hydrolase [Spirochaetia bacterium]|jgi:glycosidase|nr:alpha-amylase family glycosyl hydrolase [Spirochaetia bacterium]